MAVRHRDRNSSAETSEVCRRRRLAISQTWFLRGGKRARSAGAIGTTDAWAGSGNRCVFRGANRKRLLAGYRTTGVFRARLRALRVRASGWAPEVDAAREPEDFRSCRIPKSTLCRPGRMFVMRPCCLVSICRQRIGFRRALHLTGVSKYLLPAVEAGDPRQGYCCRGKTTRGDALVVCNLTRVTLNRVPSAERYLTSNSQPGSRQLTA
jgi:hypothetical protein